MRRNIILHTHIFKNAGTTFDALLERNFKDKFIDHREDKKLLKGKEKYLKDYLRRNRNIIAFSSHSIHFHPKDDGEFCFFQIYFLRHPIERVLSVYNFERKQPEDVSVSAKMAKRLDFNDYVVWGLREDAPTTIRNSQTIFLSGEGPSVTNMEQKFLLAKEYVRSSNLIGVVDKFDESLKVIKKELEPFFPTIDFSNYEKKNVSNQLIGSLDEKIGKILEMLDKKVAKLLLLKNKYDLELYKIAKDKILTNL